MRNSTITSLFAAIFTLLVPAVRTAVPTTCGCDPAKNFGTTKVITYPLSAKCKGSNTIQTAKGPPIPKKDFVDVYSECYVAPAFRSIQLKNTSQLIANYCGLYYYTDESCGNGNGAESALAGVCYDNVNSAPSKSFQLQCYTY